MVVLVYIDTIVTNCIKSKTGGFDLDGSSVEVPTVSVPLN